MKPRSNYDTQNYKDNEPGGGPELVETVGYTPLRQMVEQYMSGMHVQTVPIYYDDTEDPTKARDFDLADFTRMNNELERSVSEEKIRKSQQAQTSPSTGGAPNAPAVPPPPAVQQASQILPT